MIHRRQFLSALASALLTAPSLAMAIGKGDAFSVAQLEYDGNFDPRPDALRRLLLEVDKRTSIDVDPEPRIIKPDDPEIFKTPFLVLAGDRKFEPFSEDAISTLRTFLRSGGFLFVDSSEGVQDGPFIRSVEREIQRIFPDSPSVRIPRDQVVYKSFYLIDKPTGRLLVNDHMTGVFDDDRLAIVVSQNDLHGAWSRDMFGNWTFECTPGGERQREFAFRLGINIVLYALCINYKADQVHIPFILKRRDWRVD